MPESVGIGKVDICISSTDSSVPYLEVTISPLHALCSHFSRLAVLAPFSGRQTSG